MKPPYELRDHTGRKELGERGKHMGQSTKGVLVQVKSLSSPSKFWEPAKTRTRSAFHYKICNSKSKQKGKWTW